MTKAFLLTRQVQDTHNGIQLEFWFSTANGPLQVFVNQQQAVFFIRQSDVENAGKLIRQGSAEIKKIELQDFKFNSMAAVYCNSLQYFYRLRDQLKDNSIRVYESDIRPTERYLTERFITASVTLHNPQNLTRLVNPAIKPDHYQPAFKLMSIDIETDYKTDELFSIAYICNDIKRVLIIGQEPTDKYPKFMRFVNDERQLLNLFIQQVHELDPDIFIGWNVINFDFRFLQKKSEKLNIALKLGRNHSAIKWRQHHSEANHYFLHIPGRVVLDGIDTLKSATWQFPSFSLDNVANELLKRGKLIQQHNNHDPLFKAKEIKRQFYEDKISLAKYNLEDCQLVLEIFEKAELIHFAIERARLTGLEMDRVGGSVAAFDNLYLPRLHRKGFVAPNIGDYSDGNTAPGGYVMNSKPGLFDSVLVLDYKSLYPSIIRTFKVDPYARIAAKTLSDDETIPGYDGASFSKHKHILPDIIADLWQARDKAKLQKNSALSQAIKIIMNSFYGVLGTPGCRIHDARLTSSITKRSHDIIKQSVKLINEQGYDVIYGDTDSVFVSLEKPVDNNTANEIGTQLINIINSYWHKHLKDEYNIASFLEMEYETHFTRFFMPTIRGSEKGSKKRYAGIVNKNGTNKTSDNKIIFKGLENVRTDWTQLARDFQQNLYEKIFNNEAYKDFILGTVRQLNNGELDNQLVYRKRLRQKLDLYHKNIPPHARAAINAEAIFKQQGSPPRYLHKGWVEYVITMTGPEVLEHQTAKLNYDFYIEKQLTPIADSILFVLNDSMENILKKQIDLF